MQIPLSFYLKDSFEVQIGNVNHKHSGIGASINKTLNVSQSSVWASPLALARGLPKGFWSRTQQLWVMEKVEVSAPNVAEDGSWLFCQVKELVIFASPGLSTGNWKQNRKWKGPICFFAALQGGADPLYMADAHKEATKGGYKSAPAPKDHVLCFPCVPTIAMDTDAIHWPPPWISTILIWGRPTWYCPGRVTPMQTAS